VSNLGGRVIALVVTVLLGLAALVVPPAMAAEMGTIRGEVSDLDTTVPPEGQTQVQLQVLDGSTWRIVENYYANRNGNYTTAPLPAGTYRVEFSNPGYRTEVSEPVSVTDGSTTYVDATLVRGATIQGRVSVPSGGPGANAWIRVYERESRTTWSQLNETPVQPDGTYSVGNLAIGAYKVAFGDLYGHFATEFFDNVATLEEAQILILESGSVTTIDVTLSPVATSVTASGGPRIVGTPRVGTKVRAKIGTVTPASATIRYVWLLDGRRIKKATSRRLRLKAPMAGHRVSVKVAVTSPGLDRYTAVSRAKRVRRAR